MLEEINSLIPSDVNLLIALIGLYVAIKAFNLKIGAKVKGTYTLTSSIATNDEYVSKIILENQKDKSIVIYSIYLKISHNYYITLESFEDQPLILKPFESYKADYGPHDFYSFSFRKISLNDLLRNSKIKKTIILSTLDGKCTVKPITRKFNPLLEHFYDKRVFPIKINRLKHHDVSYGSNALFLLELETKSGFKKSVPIYKKDLHIFTNFTFTEESLQSTKSLTDFLDIQFKQHVPEINVFKVYDMRKISSERYKDYCDKVISAPSITSFEFYKDRLLLRAKRLLKTIKHELFKPRKIFK